MRKQKILLFGRSGFLGSKLLSKLANNTIIAPTHEELDLLALEYVYQKIETAQPDIIIYAAGVTKIEAAESDKELAFILNAKIPEKIAKFISPQNIPLMYISTDAVFDGYTKKYKFKENDTPHAKSTYGNSKLQGERAVLEQNRNNCIVRLISLFDINNRRNFLARILADFEAKKQVIGIVDQVQNPLYVDIAAEAIALIVDKQLTGIYHLGSLDWDTNYNFTLKFARKFGFDESLIKKISFENFMENKKAYRKKKSVLLSNKFLKISKGGILKTLDESFDLLFLKNKNN